MWTLIIESLLKIKSLAEFVSTIHNFARKHKKFTKRFFSLIHLICWITFGLVIFGLIGKSYWKYVILEKRVIEYMNQSVSICGKGTFISWILIKDNPLGDKFINFKTVKGCVVDKVEICETDETGFVYCREDDCSTERMDLNKELYSAIHPLNEVDYLIFDNFKETNRYIFTQDGKIINTNHLKESEVLPSIFKSLSSLTKEPLKEINIKIVRDVSGRMTHAFTFGFVEGAVRSCEPSFPEKTLQNLERLSKPIS